jgi:hypothetical protein
MNHANQWICLMSAGLWLAGNAVAAEPPATVALTLVGGVETAAPGDRYTRDMELDLTLRDGKFEPKVWGYAISLQKCDHEGEIVRAEGDKLTIKLTLLRDAFGLRNAKNPLGTAEYQITLKRDGDQYTGTFTGTIRRGGQADGAAVKDAPAVTDSSSLRALLAGRGQTNQPKPETTAPAPAPAAPSADQTVEVKGQVVGRVIPSWTEPVAGFKKLEPNEHPRLIFRKSDLPLIKKRLETPEGKAIMARFLEQLPKSHGDWPKVQMYLPAGYGLAYQLTGDKAHADKAKAILTDMLGLGGSQDIHYGPMAQSMAVTLDFCYDAWDAEFRQKVIDNLARRMMNLETLTGMGGASLNPWHNHEAIRAAGAGVAAICLLGEKTGDGKEIAGLERIIHVNARSTRRFFQYNGDSGSGWGLEGDAYKRMVWNSGPGHVVQACRSALGTDPVANGLGAWSILGEWMWLPPGDDVVQSETSRGFADNGQRGGGFFILGLTTVPDSMKAGVRWLFDRSYGLQGDKTFNLLWAYHAAYLLMNYPFDVPAKPPTESLPWVAPDPSGGHWVFRKPWQGAQDTLVVLNPSFDNPGGSHWITGRSWDMQLFALGKLWIGDRRMDDKTGTPGAALPTTANAGAYTSNLGARLLGWSSTPDGRASLAWDNSPIYMTQLARDAMPGPDQKSVRMSRQGQFVDHGIRATRHMAVDLSGASGAPVLLAILDQSKGAKDFAWNLKLAKEAGPAKVEGNTITVGDPAGANMKVTFVGAKTPALTPAIKATGSDEYFAIITVQKGPAPEVKVDGDKVTVGGVPVVLGK